MSDVETALLIVLLAFAPSLILLYWFRNLEHVEREPWKTVWQAYRWGAVSAVLATVILSWILATAIFGSINIYDAGSDDTVKINDSAKLLISVIIIAPFVEEGAKAWGISRRARSEIDEVEDGSIYGAACGLGFSGTENFFYGIVAWDVAGANVALTLMILRISGTLLHASATSLTGHGYGRYAVETAPFTVVIRYYLLAVLLHALFNTATVTANLLGFLFAIILAFAGFEFTKRRIQELDTRRHELKNETIIAQQPSRESWWEDNRAAWQKRRNARQATNETSAPQTTRGTPPRITDYAALPSSQTPTDPRYPAGATPKNRRRW